MTRFDRAAVWLALAAFFFAPLSKPGTNIALGLLVFFLPFVSNFRDRLRTQVSSPMVKAGALMFVAYAVSALHSDSPQELWSYRTLLGLALIGVALPTDELRIRAWLAFMLGSGVLLVFSIASGFDLVPRASTTAIGQFGFSKHYGQQSLVYVVSAAACASFVFFNTFPRIRCHLMIATVLFALSTPLLLEGRMAWLVLAVVFASLSIYFFGSKRGVLLTLVAVLCLSSVAWLSPLRESRWRATTEDIQAAGAGEVSGSWGVRAELLRIAPLVVAKAPVFGHGLGSWNAQMRSVAPERMNPLIENLRNPHQEILFIAAEQGLIGVSIYGLFAFLLIRCVVRMRGLAKPLYVALLIAYLGNGLFNAVLSDATHRHAFLVLLAAVPVGLRSYAK